MYKKLVSENLNSLNYSRINDNEIALIFNIPITQIQIDYLEIKTSCSNLYKELSENNYNLYLQNDSCFITNSNQKILELQNIYGIEFVKEQNCLFIFDSLVSFIFIDLNIKTKKHSSKLPFKIDCFQGMCFTVLNILFDNEINKYKLTLTNWIEDEDPNDIFPYCFYDSSSNLIIPNLDKPKSK